MTKPRTKSLITARILAAVEFEATPPSRYSPQNYDEACWQRQEKWQREARVLRRILKERMSK